MDCVLVALSLFDFQLANMYLEQGLLTEVYTVVWFNIPDEWIIVCMCVL